MPILKIPTPMRTYVNGASLVRVNGKDAGDAMESLLTQYPALRPHLTRSNGKLRAFVNLFVGKNNIRDLKGLKTPVGEDEEIQLVLSIAGG
jgi:molybdopterin converting factor small subunit